MKNLDMKDREIAQIRQQIMSAVKAGDEDAFAAAFGEFAQQMQDSVMAEARGLIQAADNTILTGRGVRALTSQETRYYEKLIGAMKSNSPQQALTLIDETLPKTVIDAIFEDVIEAHPLLGAINFQNTGILTEILVSTSDGRHLATWGQLCSDIAKEISAGTSHINLEHNKLSAFIPVCKAMLEIGPEWIDRYVRGILAEAIANGLEKAIILGTGVSEPVGMTKDPNGVFHPVNGYPDLIPVVVTQITPATYGAIVAALSVGPNALYRNVTEVLLVVNPVDYFTKLIPAVTVRAADGTYVERFPFPTRVIQSAYVPANKAIIGLPRRYFFGLGSGKGGKIEYSDHYKFIEDDRYYLIKMYGDGKPLDSTSFKVLDISALVPVVSDVNVNNWPAVTDVDVITDPINVAGVYDARLSSLKIGAKTLSPAFNKSIFAYTCTTTDATNTITAVAKDGEATIAIINGETPVENGAAATWADGANTLTVTVTRGTETETYTVTVTKTAG